MNNTDLIKIMSFLKKWKSIINETKTTLTVLIWEDTVNFYDFSKKIEIKETGQTLFYFETELITNNWEGVWWAQSKYIKWKYRAVLSSWYIVIGFSGKNELKIDWLLSNEIYYFKKGNVIETNIEKMWKIIK